MFKNIPVLLIFAFLSAANLQAQKLNHHLGQILIKLKPNEDIKAFIPELDQFQGKRTHSIVEDEIIPGQNIWLIHFDHNAINENDFINFIFKKKSVEQVQFNKLISLRNEPNDTRFEDQWQYINDGSFGGIVDADLDADLAWDITTGGLTPQGDTIVVAVIDDGIDLEHDDFGNNLWINHGEIPDNDIDDDMNGYIDDYLGFNSNAENDIDNVEGGGHGTPVAGIIGAKGNNARGVAGVNWDVKLMIIRNNFNTDEANVLKAYGYALTQRTLYNESNGMEGAYVVSTNASWGVDLGNPLDAPLWCDFYNTLGAAGILNCGATINDNVDIDRQGDLPTACDSDFLVSVTNMNRQNEKVNNAGYGLENIDLGAFGEGTFTTSGGGGYSGFGGTSGATPHVAGTIALLYAAPCPNLTNLSKSNPAEAALFARRYILEGVKPNASLENITVTGGVLNMNNSLNLLMNDCDGCNVPTSLKAESILDISADLTWAAFNSALAVNLNWREVGNDTWNTVLNVEPPYSLTGIVACTEYEFQVEAICGSETSGYSENVIFKTRGCCEPPIHSEANPQETSVELNWEDVLIAQSYNLRYKEESSTEWILVENIEQNSYNLNDLPNCNSYLYQINTNCPSSTTDWSDEYTFTTSGCGACFDLIYCSTGGDDSSQEWIEAITINNIENVSGQNNGYASFENLQIDLPRGGLYPINLQPGYDGGSFPEYFRIWIDYSQDGDFDESEMVFDAGAATTTSISTDLYIRDEAALGITKMRISMKWTGALATGDTPPEPCEDPFDFGETEDYCINILESVAGCPSQPLNLRTDNLGGTFAFVRWDAIDEAQRYLTRFKLSSETNWIESITDSEELILLDLSVCTEYEVEVKAFCSGAGSEFSEVLSFKTECIDNVNNATDNASGILLSPNPFYSDLSIQVRNIPSNTMDVIKIYDNQGKLISTLKNVFIKEDQIQLNLEKELYPGLYFIICEWNKQSFFGKAIKI